MPSDSYALGKCKVTQLAGVGSCETFVESTASMLG